MGLFKTRFLKYIFFLVLVFVLSSCNNSDRLSLNDSQPSGPFDSKQMITLRVSSPSALSFYAAARFLEQATFGYTTSDVALVQQIGMSAWIDQQMSLPASQVDWSSICCYASNSPTAGAGTTWAFPPNAVLDLAIGGKDQLRLRTTYSLSMYIPASGHPPAQSAYFNFLQNNSLSKYGDFLKALTLNPTMGGFLNLNQDQNPGSCSNCSFNENYPRELLQLFTMGTKMLNQDGSLQLDSNGKPIQTYSQDDVSNMARLLSGWSYDNLSKDPMSIDAPAFESPMINSNPRSHDTTSKTLLGTTIPAGGTAAQDLDQVIKIIMAQPNVAPFVSLRLIQNFVTSAPSPAYISRVASVFSSSQGDMKQVVKAILLDPEARTGDVPSNTNNSTGKVREPFLFTTQVWRALGCTKAPVSPTDPTYRLVASYEQPLAGVSVFGYYEPSYQPVGGARLAPESKLDNSMMFSEMSAILSYYSNSPSFVGLLQAAGCTNVMPLLSSYGNSDTYLSLVNQLFFKQAMPSVIQNGALGLMQTYYKSGVGYDSVFSLKVASLLLSTPSFGVMK
jgi:uncharacterized protein (DUF1800 family)